MEQLCPRDMMGSVCKHKTAVCFFLCFAADFRTLERSSTDSPEPQKNPEMIEGHVSVRVEGRWPPRAAACLFFFWLYEPH